MYLSIILFKSYNDHDCNRNTARRGCRIHQGFNTGLLRFDQCCRPQDIAVPLLPLSGPHDHPAVRSLSNQSRPPVLGRPKSMNKHPRDSQIKANGTRFFFFFIETGYYLDDGFFCLLLQRGTWVPRELFLMDRQGSSTPSRVFRRR